MGSLHSVNERILYEVESLDADEPIKKLLNEILHIELNNLDKDRVKYQDHYMKAIDKVISEYDPS